ncbi:MAG: ABC transporter substrate-binding protein [Acidobacteria bacterium]|nr:ABC transporter substrate-binding protein [Acidobacteriota bacterium]
MLLTRRDWLGLSTAALATAAWPARAQERPLRMLLNSGYTGANAFLLLADDKGYLKEAGASVTFTPGVGAYTAAERMVKEGFDIGYGDINALIEVVSRDPAHAPLAVYMVFNSSPSVLVVKADSDVQVPYDLVGKRLVGHATDVALNMFGIYAGLARVDPDDITIQTTDVPMAAMLKELVAGKVDGVFGYNSTVRAAAAAEGIDADTALRFFKYEDLMTDSYGSAIMVNRELLTSSPDLVRRVLRAFTRGLRDAIVQPDAAVAAVVQRDATINRTIEKARLQHTLAGEMAHPEGQRIGIGDTDPGRLATCIVQMVELRKLQRVPGILEVFRDDYLPPLNERITSLGQ